MAGTGASSPFIKEEPEDQYYQSHNDQRFMAGAPQNYVPQQQHFGQFGNPHGGSINPNDLTMAGNGVAIPNGAYGSSPFGYANNHSGRGQFGDDELLDSLEPNSIHSNHQGMHVNGSHGISYDMPANTMYPMHNGTPALSVDPNNFNDYSNTPEGDPIQSPFVSNFNHAQFRMQPQNAFGNSLHSGSYASSPIIGSDMHNGLADAGGFSKQQRPRLNATLGRKSSNRSPLTPKTTSNMAALQIGSTENANFGAQPIRTHSSHRHQKTLSDQWNQTANSLGSFPGSEFSPMHTNHPTTQISDVLKGASMPAKLNNGHSVGSAPALQSQELKRRRRRESHNLVERRRRDNINERIQELSHLVPMHRLEDEKVRKALQNNSPLSPTLAATGMSPPQATSGLAGPGARRATAGNITTGIPIEEKDKGPNKGDILNGAVSWTRDLMWMLHTKIHQMEELNNYINDLGGKFPFQQSENEKRMQTELMDSMIKNDSSTFEYSRAPGTGLRVPKHTDVRGDALGRTDNSMSPGNGADAGLGGAGQYWSGQNSSGPGSISFKEEDEYGMDLTQ